MLSNSDSEQSSMTYLAYMRKVIPGYKITAEEDVYGQKVMLAWEFDPQLFKQMMKQLTAALKLNKVEFDLLNDRKNFAHQMKMPGQGMNLSQSKGNDWSHITIGLLDNYQEGDLAKLEELAKASKPTWKIKGLDVLKTQGKLHYVVADLDYPPGAVTFEKAMRAYGKGRFSMAHDRGWTLRPHVTFVGVLAEDVDKVKGILKGLNFTKSAVPVDAIQVWDAQFHVVEHVLL